MSGELQGLYESVRRQRQVTHKQAAAQMGLRLGTLRAWRSDPEHRLILPRLEPLARWIAELLPWVDLAEAIRLQGGTEEDRLREIAPAAHAAHLALLSADNKSSRARKYRRAFRKNAPKHFKGVPLSEQHRKLVGKGIKAAWARDDHPPAFPLHATARGRAQQMLRSIRYRQPDLTAQQARERVTERLQELYGFPRDVARGFFKPLPPKRGGTGRPRQVEHCEAFQQLARKERWDGYGDPERGFWVRLAMRVNLDPNAAREWYVRDFPTCRDCLVALAELDGKTEEMPCQEVNGQVL